MAKRISQLAQITASQIAQTDLVPVVDVSAGQTKYSTVKDLTGLPDLGWTATGESLSYSSWDSARRIGVITVPTDATTKYNPKMRVRFSQTTGGTKYGIITYVTATTLTVHFPSGTTLANEAITSPVYSPLDTPVGFPSNPNSWMLSFESGSTTAQTSPTGSLWYNTGSPLIALGAGNWRVRGRAAFQLTGAVPELLSALSTSSSSPSHNMAVIRDYQASRSVPTLNTHTHLLDVDLSANGTVYIIYKSPNGGTFDNRGDTGTPHVTRIEAVTNYL